MLRRAFVLLLGTVALAGCGGGSGYGPRGYRPGAGARCWVVSLVRPGGPAGQRVAILLPLSGPRADIGQAMLHAAQLALDGPGAPPLDAKDTGGTPSGAAAAAQSAIAEGAGLILGPLTSPETAAVAPVARAANVAVLAFTNDPVAGAARRVDARHHARPAGAPTGGRGAGARASRSSPRCCRRTISATPWAQALNQATASNGAAPPNVRFYASGMPAINAAARDVSGYASRRGPIDAQMRAARALGHARGQASGAGPGQVLDPAAEFQHAASGGHRRGAGGDRLGAAVLRCGPLRGADHRAGAVGLAAPAAPASSAAPGTPHPIPRRAPTSSRPTPPSTAARPPPLADLAYDAASIARVVGGRGYSVGALTQPSGFVGADGWFALLSDGQVRRALAVFAIERGGPQMVEPAPQSGNVPGV